MDYNRNPKRGESSKSQLHAKLVSEGKKIVPIGVAKTTGYSCGDNGNPDLYLRPHTNYMRGETWDSHQVQTMKLQAGHKKRQGSGFGFGAGRALQRTQTTTIREYPEKKREKK